MVKGSGKFWKRESAERKLLLRRFFVTARLDALFDFALVHRVAVRFTGVVAEMAKIAEAMLMGSENENKELREKNEALELVAPVGNWSSCL